MVERFTDISLTGVPDPLYVVDDYQRRLVANRIDPKKFYNLNRILVLDYGIDLDVAKRLVENFVSLDNTDAVAENNGNPVTKRMLAAMNIDHLFTNLTSPDLFKYPVEKSKELDLKFAWILPPENSVIPHAYTPVPDHEYSFDAIETITLPAPDYDKSIDIGVLRPTYERKNQVIPLLIDDLEQGEALIDAISLDDSSSRLNSNGKRSLQSTRNGKVVSKIYDVPVRSDVEAMFDVPEWTPYLLLRRERRSKRIMAAVLRRWRSDRVNRLRAKLWAMGFVHGNGIDLTQELNWIRESAVHRYDSLVLYPIHEKYITQILDSNACSKNVTVEELTSYYYDFLDLLWAVNVEGRNGLDDEINRVSHLLLRYYFGNLSAPFESWLKMKGLFRLANVKGDELASYLQYLSQPPTATNTTRLVVEFFNRATFWNQQFEVKVKTARENTIRHVEESDSQNMDRFYKLLRIEEEVELHSEQARYAKKQEIMDAASYYLGYYVQRAVLSNSHVLFTKSNTGPRGIQEWNGIKVINTALYPEAMFSFALTVLPNILAFDLGDNVKKDILDYVNVPASDGWNVISTILGTLVTDGGDNVDAASLVDTNTDVIENMKNTISYVLQKTRHFEEYKYLQPNIIEYEREVARSGFAAELGQSDIDLSAMITGVLYTKEEEEQFDIMMRLKDLDLDQARSKRPLTRMPMRKEKLLARPEGELNKISIHPLVLNPLRGRINGAEPFYTFVVVGKSIYPQNGIENIDLFKSTTQQESMDITVDIPRDFNGYLVCTVSVLDNAGGVIAQGNGPTIQVEQLRHCVRCGNRYSPFDSSVVRARKTDIHGRDHNKPRQNPNAMLPCTWELNLVYYIKDVELIQLEEAIDQLFTAQGLLSLCIIMQRNEDMLNVDSDWYFKRSWLSMNGVDRNSILAMIDEAALQFKLLQQYKDLNKKTEEEMEEFQLETKTKLLTKLGMWEKINDLWEKERLVNPTFAPQLYTLDNFTNNTMTRLLNMMSNPSVSTTEILGFIMNKVPYLMVINYMLYVIKLVLKDVTKSHPDWVPEKLKAIDKITIVFKQALASIDELSGNCMKFFRCLTKLKSQHEVDEEMTMSQVFDLKKVIPMSAAKLAVNKDMFPCDLEIFKEIDYYLPSLNHVKAELGQGVMALGLAHKAHDSYNSMKNMAGFTESQYYRHISAARFIGRHSSESMLPNIFELGYGDETPIMRRIETHQDLVQTVVTRGLTLLYGDTRDLYKNVYKRDEDMSADDSILAIEQTFDRLMTDRNLSFDTYLELVDRMKNLNNLIYV